MDTSTSGIMSFPNYALYYFPDSDLVKVDSTDIILREHRRQENQVNSREQFESEDGYIEVRLPSRSRHGQIKILPAKILLLGDIDSYYSYNTRTRQKCFIRTGYSFQPSIRLNSSDLPGIVASLKEVLESMKRGPLSSSPNSNEMCLSETSEMISLCDSDVKIPKRVYDRLNKSRASLFTQELATVLFGREILARCTLTGKSGTQSKDQLDPHKVQALIDTVIKQFPTTTVSEVRALIRRKCNNEANSKFNN
ncbi:hypothetical protein PO909_028009 [Leuciscus waleckii]